RGVLRRTSCRSFGNRLKAGTVRSASGPRLKSRAITSPARSRTIRAPPAASVPGGAETRMTRSARTAFAGAASSLRSPGGTGRFPDAVEVRLGANDEAVPDQGGRGHRELAETVLPEYLELLPRLDRERFAVFAEAEDPIEIDPGRGGEGAALRSD